VVEALTDVDTYRTPASRPIDRGAIEPLSVQPSRASTPTPRLILSHTAAAHQPRFRRTRSRVPGGHEIASPAWLTRITVSSSPRGHRERKPGACSGADCGSTPHHGMQVWDNLAPAARAVRRTRVPITSHAMAMRPHARRGCESACVATPDRPTATGDRARAAGRRYDLDRFRAFGVIHNMQPRGPKWIRWYAQAGPLTRIGPTAAKQYAGTPRRRSESAGWR